MVYNLFLGQEPVFDDVTAWIHPCVEDLDRLPDLRVQWNIQGLNDVMETKKS